MPLSRSPFSIGLWIGRIHFIRRRYQEALACVQAILQDQPGHLLTII
jgi:hypothetical protein